MQLTLVMCTSMQNATKVKTGKEFGANEGKLMITVKALYGLKLSGAAWSNLLSSSIKDLGFTSSKAGPGLYYRA